ncbi:hypothetical protein LXL04_036109 [Taraxacum kok-saghyz]
MTTGKPGCLTKCGELTVPYPFGIQKGCSIDESFELTCNTTLNPPKLFLIRSQFEFEIYSISNSEIKVSNLIAYNCYDKSGYEPAENSYETWQDLDNSPFTYSEKNRFTIIGCDTLVLIRAMSGVDFASSCVGSCNKQSDVSNDECSGIGCCQTSIPKGAKSYDATLLFLNRTEVRSFNPCSYGFLGEQDSFRFRGEDDLFKVDELWDRISSLPVVVDWVIGGNGSCTEATECKGNSDCHDGEMGGYTCICKQGYQGNPYLDPGCKDINECLDNRTYPCYGDCINTEGSYNCTCKRGYTGNGTIHCQLISGGSKFPAKVFSLGTIHKYGCVNITSYNRYIYYRVKVQFGQLTFWIILI